ncbi:enoyl-CoA hydratase-related protein [Nocardia sp. CA-135398]|uniref:enoyl-CoA hydratase-related protein n=1 Tax=Nocardia sp. CA-135398 TaxID=3239977 RepID=UPI003D9513E8
MTVFVKRHDAIAVVTINRPEVRNALDANTIAGIGSALQFAEEDTDVRAVVLTGAGDRAFCAGMDLRAFASGASLFDDSRPGLESITQRTFPKPVIAAINGAALAGGFELMLACDLAVAAEHATFGLPEVKRGLVAVGGGTNLPRRIPLAVALELGLTGESINAARAFELGLVNRVVPAAQLLAEALELAGLISRNGPLALRITKELMLAQASGATPQELAPATARVLRSADAKEGATAFAEKRVPRWTGV